MDLMSLLPPEILSIVLTTAGPESYYNLCLVSTAMRLLTVKLRRLIFRVDNITDQFFKQSEETTMEEISLGPLVVYKEIYNVDKYYTNSLSWVFKIHFPIGWIKFLCRASIGSICGKVRRGIDSFEYKNGWQCHEFIININKWIDEIFEGKLNCLLVTASSYCDCVDCIESRGPKNPSMIPVTPFIYSLDHQRHDAAGDIFEVNFDSIDYSGCDRINQTGIVTRLPDGKWTEILSINGVQLKYNGNYQWIMNQIYTNYRKT